MVVVMVYGGCSCSIDGVCVWLWLSISISLEELQPSYIVMYDPDIGM